jgi:SAM-dependent methyltransferase
MRRPTDAAPIDFDEFAGEYDEALHRGVSISGENKDYFARGRVEWLRRCLPDVHPDSILDYGCGTGGSAPLLREVFGARAVLGIDTSAAAIAAAQRDAAGGTRFARIDEFRPGADFDLAYCNGVFHHVPPAERMAAVRCVHDALKPGGWFAMWENNPWNPGTRIVMSRIPFDRDAVTLSALEARRMLRDGGFDVLQLRFLFIFPKMLGALRPLEAPLSRLPLGAQYQVLCRKPFSRSSGAS